MWRVPRAWRRYGPSSPPHDAEASGAPDNAAMSSRGAAVRVLPPLLYLIPLLVAWFADRIVPLGLHGGAAGRWVGGLLIALGLALLTWAFVTFQRHGTTVVPWARVHALTTDGPYRYTRNPIYVADALSYLGACLVLDNAWALLMLPVVLVATYRLVIRHEEAYLADLFGRAYADYRRRVRRWL